ncbi:hypothetical protein SAMN04487943_104128 [Gracilibacillus orientalis]|uniref:Uncharacterized protein n=1 Tax=Gracilibacillus orientalis TaxID=334253 RepID=A0A1I4KSL1_9BACI|nr:hypothetical protein [Gracilibacillus orientalis]SFL81603.1 hypothetical protein SAMN04487943_104128 [Gracilibacillus orientalis]
MDEERKQTIINEINYWKKSQLLPNQYCDFLLALYTEGEGVTTEEDKGAKQTPYYLLFYFLDTLLILLPFLIFQVTDNLLAQMIGIVLTLCTAFVMIKLFSRHDELQDSYAVMICFVVFLFSTVLWMTDYIRISGIVYIWIFINSISWITFGKIKKQFFLQIAGVFILIILTIMLGFHYF